MTQPDTYALLHEIFSEVFSRDDIALHPETTAKDVPGWDSFKQIEIILALEDRLNIKFTSRELDSLQCVGDLAQQVARKTAG